MKTKEITLTAIMLTILIICSQLSLPIGPVPITLQTLAVMMIGYLLTPRNALLATSIYLIIGLAGLPVFSAFSGGLQYVFMPSFGFALSFIPASYLQAKYLERNKPLEFRHLITAGLLNFFVTYLIGLTYMAGILNIYMNNQLNFVGILMAGFIPFLLGDILKIIVAVTLAKKLLPIIEKSFATI